MMREDQQQTLQFLRDLQATCGPIGVQVVVDGVVLENRLYRHRNPQEASKPKRPPMRSAMAALGGAKR